MKKILLLLFVTFSVTFSYAQTATVKGVINDTINKQTLSNAVISILRAKDSVLVKFTRSNAKGGFEVKNLKAGNYLVLATFPEYADYAEAITLTDTSNLNLGPLKLILKANLLQDVIVKQQLGSIRLKGDTTEFIADSFKVQANATVEDLLKKLPGIQVDKNGKITAQGETVKKVLVDGEEFFGDDPTLVTQNLRADMVGSVQVFDKKSDQAAFTGIDDGTKDKTINLKLKDGKKNGYFGKLNVGGGTDGYHENQLMFNAFKNKSKFAAYGIVSNTGKTGLNWQDNNSYGDQGSGMFGGDDDGGMFIMIGGGGDDDIDGWNGQYSGKGYPLVQTGGLHYNTKWGGDKQSINGNYKILNLGVVGNSASQTQSIQSPDTTFYQNDFQKFTNRILRNRLNGTYEVQFDSSTSLKVTADGGTDHKNSLLFDSSDSRYNDQFASKGLRHLSTVSDNNTVNSNILLRKKFKKKGRTLSFNLKENYTNNQSTGYLDNTIQTFNSTPGTTRTDQYKIYNSRNALFDTKVTYTEPLSKTSSLIFNYGVVVDNSNSQRTAFNKTDEGKYTKYDSLYSNHYQFDVFTNRGGMAFNYSKKKVRFNVGTNLGFTNFKQTDLRYNIESKRDYTNFYPQASFTYSFTQQRRLFISYNGNTRQPSIQQIQPVKNNDDPLNINEGNPNLKQEYSNRINVNFNDFKVLTSRSIFGGFNYSFTNNAIVSNTTLDVTTGIRTNRYVNLNGNHSLNGYLYYGLKLKKLDAYLNFNGNINSSRNNNIVNGLLNTTNSGSYTGGLNFNKEKEKKFSISLNAYATYTKSTNNNGLIETTTNYWTYSVGPNFDIFLPAKFQLHGEGDFNIRPKTNQFPANNVFLVNAWFGRKFLTNDALVIKVSGNDILNQNIGFNRQVSSTFISQNTYSTISRFFLLSAVWNFTKAGTVAPKQMF